jgi:hypothetical protein
MEEKSIDSMTAEEQLIHCLKTSGLGVEGLVPYEWFSAGGRIACNNLIKQGKVILVTNPIAADMGNVVRIPNEIYPDSFNEVMISRNDPDAWVLLKAQKEIAKELKSSS